MVVCFFLASRNLILTTLLTQIIQLWTRFYDHPIQFICLEDAREFKSQNFRTYCELIGVQLEHSLSYVHETNGLA